MNAEKQALILELQGKLKVIRSTAVQVKNIGDQVRGWEPIPGRCHENVDRWISSRPTDGAVRGWIVTDYSAFPGCSRMTSHSVVETRFGELLDITLPAHECHHLFVRHPGPNQEFAALVADNGCPWIDIPLEGPDPRLFDNDALHNQIKTYPMVENLDNFEF